MIYIILFLFVAMILILEIAHWKICGDEELTRTQFEALSNKYKVSKERIRQVDASAFLKIKNNRHHILDL